MTKRLNIAALSRTTYWHGMRGGMDVHGKLLSQGLAARGHRVVFISTRHPSGKVLDLDGGVELHYLPDTVFGSRRHSWSDKSVQALEEIGRQVRFDLVWSQSFDGFGLAKGIPLLAKLPVLATLHGCIAQELTSFIENVRRQPYRPVFICKGLAGLFYSYRITQKPLLRRAQRIVTVSRRVGEDLRTWYGPAVFDKCLTIYNGIDTSVFHPDERARDQIRRRYDILPHTVVLLTLGRLTHEKGHHILIEALAILREKLPRIKLLIVGEGQNMGTLKKMAERLSVADRVIFTGSVENRETPCFYNAADLFLFPTLTVEGLPFVLLEAMACGKPVIASNIGGNNEIICDREDGILVNPGNAQLISDKIMMLVGDGSYCKQIGVRALSKISKNFCLYIMIDRYEHEMNRLVRTVASG